MPRRLVLTQVCEPFLPVFCGIVLLHLEKCVFGFVSFLSRENPQPRARHSETRPPSSDVWRAVREGGTGSLWPRSWTASCPMDGQGVGSWGHGVPGSQPSAHWETVEWLRLPWQSSVGFFVVTLYLSPLQMFTNSLSAKSHDFLRQIFCVFLASIIPHFVFLSEFSEWC